MQHRAWSCTTRTSNSTTSDIWHSRFSVVSASGLTLFETPTFDSPMMDATAVYDWSRAFIHDSTIFNEIDGVIQHYSC
jgi:hypothetical protein